MKSDNESGEDSHGHVVEFIDREEHTTAVVACHFPDVDKEPGKILLKILRVSAGDSIDIDPELRTIGQLHTESLEDPQSSLGARADTTFGIHLQQHQSQCAGELAGKPTIFSHLDMGVKESVAVSQSLEFVEEHGLSDPAQPSQ